MPLLPEQTFAEWSESIRPALENAARSSHCTDPEIVAQDAIVQGYRSRTAFDADTGREGLARWLFGILDFSLSSWHRQRRRDRRRCEACTDDIIEVDRWSRLVDHRPDPEMLEEVGLRLRHANLSRIQRKCLASLLNGWTLEQSAELLAMTAATVRYHRTTAIQRLKEVDLEVELGATDLDKHLWRAENWWGGCHVTVYHKPTSTGAGLATSDLRNGTCSVTRKVEF